ncbi:MAG: hypothetical protein NUW09_05105 [Deltaproteobacteria bacterium]|nr:hypothetical protein [Deltaproteobacteria bacterium]
MKVFLRYTQLTRREKDFSLTAEQRRIEPQDITSSGPRTQSFKTIALAMFCFVQKMKDDPDIEDVSLHRYDTGGLISNLKRW